MASIGNSNQKLKYWWIVYHPSKGTSPATKHAVSQSGPLLHQVRGAICLYEIFVWPIKLIISGSGSSHRQECGPDIVNGNIVKYLLCLPTQFTLTACGRSWLGWCACPNAPAWNPYNMTLDLYSPPSQQESDVHTKVPCASKA